MIIRYQGKTPITWARLLVSWLYPLFILLHNSQVSVAVCGDSVHSVLRACTDSSVVTLTSVSTDAVFIDLAALSVTDACTCHMELLQEADEAVFVVANLESSSITSGQPCTSYAEQVGQCGEKDIRCSYPVNTWSEFLLERPLKPNTAFNFMPDTASNLCIKYTVQRDSGNVKMWCTSNLAEVTTSTAATTLAWTTTAAPTTTTSPTTTSAPTTTTAPTTTANPATTAAPTITTAPTTTAGPTSTTAPTTTAGPTTTAAPTSTSAQTTTTSPTTTAAPTTTSAPATTAATTTTAAPTTTTAPTTTAAPTTTTSPRTTPSPTTTSTVATTTAGTLSTTRGANDSAPDFPTPKNTASRKTVYTYLLLCTILYFTHG